PAAKMNESFRIKHVAGLSLLLAVALFLRLYNCAWDDGLLFHPDEANLIRAVQRIDFPGQLDPGFFAYNGFPIYLFRAATDLVSAIVPTIEEVAELKRIVVVSRVVSAVIATASVLVIYLLGCKIQDRRLGYVAAVLLAMNTGMIQTAHFAVTENLMVFWLLLLTYLTVTSTGNTRGFLRGSWKMGVVLGLALGTKTTALSYFLIPFSGVLPGWWHTSRADGGRWSDWAKGLLLVGAVAAVTFILVTPYTFLRWDDFRDSMRYEWSVVSGNLPVFYTIQFSNTNDYLFSAENLHWLCGPLVPLAAIAGAVIWLFKTVRTRRPVAILPLLIFGIAYFLYTGGWHAKFIRYMTLLVPVLAICAAGFVCTMWPRPGQSSWRILPAVLVVGSSVVWSALFFSIYLRSDTRLTASEWMADNISHGSRIVYEWDNYPVLPQPPDLQAFFAVESILVYDPDNLEKIQRLAQQLSQADYLVLTSSRFHTTIPRARERFPLTAQFYHALLAGEVGYQVCAEFSSLPGFGSWSIDDSGAEETFRVFDHPRVMILINRARMPADSIVQSIFSRQ
ncbi:MAG: glycosyltransferase family 39 protein, partial [Planctomycetales bacterium]|nr:glycosyltransferase family 39 protein [Planctomycetales bacterium]